SLPVDTPRDLKAYRVKGTADLSRLTLAGVELEKVRARLDYADGVLQLSELRGALPPAGGATGGRFDGSARLGVIPEGDLTARLTLDRIPLGQLARAAPALTDQLGGAVSGEAELRVPAGRLTDVAAWQGSGRLTSEEVHAFGSTWRGVTTRLDLSR